MKVTSSNSRHQTKQAQSKQTQPHPSVWNGLPQNQPELAAVGEMDPDALVDLLQQELQLEVKSTGQRVYGVAARIGKEVERICRKSDRIQASGKVLAWQVSLARHRLQKCLSYYRLGSKRARVELHSTLGAMVYRHIAPLRSQLGFQGRYSMIEDFLQSFYIEALKAFRRENDLPADYTPRIQLEVAEYIAFTEHYAKRRIGLPGGRSQQLIVLRAQGFAKRQPDETAIDMEVAVEFPRGEEAEAFSRSNVVQQVREQMVADTIDPAESVLRDRVIAELIQYLESQGQSDCVNYLVLKLQDMAAPEIDEILGLTARQRDYLQQRFKYHMSKFARSHHWKLVHQWLGADLDQNLGMAPQQWDAFQQQLTPEQRHLLQLKQARSSETDIAQALDCTLKQSQKRWSQLLELAWQFRNQDIAS